MDEILQKMDALGVVPVVRVDEVEKAVPLAEALIRGGLPCMEVTFRTALAEEAIGRIHAAHPEILLGAGTVLTTDQVDRAAAAGAAFIVSPGLNPKVVEHCLDKGLAVVPGCATPSDMERAMELGLKTVKFFPAEASGGVAALKAMSAPYTELSFIPTGGISEKNMASYLALPSVRAVGGSWMVAPKLVKDGEFDKIAALSAAAVSAVLDFGIAHVGVNTADEKEGTALAAFLCQVLRQQPRRAATATFVGDLLEIMHLPFLGKNGHIGFLTASVRRAMAHFEAMGLHFREDTIKRDEKGEPTFVYLLEEPGGFAIHLVQRK